MPENLDKSPLPNAEKELLSERYEIQRRLIEEFCEITRMPDFAEKNVCAIEWIEKYADNFDQLDKRLVEKYKNIRESATSHEQKEEEIKNVLQEIQMALIDLDAKNG